MWTVGVLGVGGVFVLVWTEELGEEHPGDRFSSHSRASRCNRRAGQAATGTTGGPDCFCRYVRLVYGILTLVYTHFFSVTTFSPIFLFVEKCLLSSYKNKCVDERGCDWNLLNEC